MPYPPCRTAQRGLPVSVGRGEGWGLHIDANCHLMPTYTLLRLIVISAMQTNNGNAKEG